MNQEIAESNSQVSSVVPGVAIIISGDTNEGNSIDDDTRKKCILVMNEYLTYAKPVNHVKAGGGFIRRDERGCAVNVIIYSPSTNENYRKDVVLQIKNHLIICYGLPERCIIDLYGRDYKDICVALSARKFTGDILVTGEKKFLAFYRFSRVCKENNLCPPKYIGP